MFLKGLECKVSKMANRDACPRPTTGDLDDTQLKCIQGLRLAQQPVN